MQGNDNKITQNFVDNFFLSTDCVNDVIVIQLIIIFSIQLVLLLFSRRSLHQLIAAIILFVLSSLFQYRNHRICGDFSKHLTGLVHI